MCPRAGNSSYAPSRGITRVTGSGVECRGDGTGDVGGSRGFGTTKAAARSLLPSLFTRASRGCRSPMTTAPSSEERRGWALHPHNNNNNNSSSSTIITQRPRSQPSFSPLTDTLRAGTAPVPWPSSTGKSRPTARNDTFVSPPPSHLAARADPTSLPLLLSAHASFSRMMSRDTEKVCGVCVCACVCVRACRGGWKG
jgi:hypothetical protein